MTTTVGAMLPANNEARTMAAPGLVESAPSVPEDLVELPRWACWKAEDGRKVPYNATTSRRASSVNPDDWGELEAAREAIRSARFDYLAFAFFEQDGLVGIDLDNCRNPDGTLKPWASGIVARFGDTYIEVSPSGGGLHIFARGSLPAAVVVKGEDGGIEAYSRARFFTYTGQRFNGAPLQLEDHTADLRALHEHYTRSKPHGWPLQPLPGGRIPHGQQHSTLVSLCGTLRARGICDEAIEVCLQTVNEKQCERPGPRANISRIVRSSRSWGVA